MRFGAVRFRAAKGPLDLSLFALQPTQGGGGDCGSS